MKSNYGSGNFFLDALENIRLYKLLSTATIFIFIACFIVTASFSTLIININKLVQEIIDKNEIVVFVKTDNTDGVNAAIRTAVETNENIASFRYVSPDEALREYVDSLGAGYENIYDEFKDDNPMRASYRIVLHDVGLTEDIAVLFRNTAGVGEVRTQQVQIDEFVKIKNIIALLSVWLIIILVVVSIFIISNTIRMTMYARKTEINIMKYVGATDMFIRVPYIIEGVLLGLIASAVAFFAEWLIYDHLIYTGLARLAFFTPYGFSHFAFPLLLCYIVAAFVFGVFGSLLPMRKYLRV